MPVLLLYSSAGSWRGHLWLVLALVPAGFLGKILGTTLLKRTSERAFRVISLGVVILTGALGLAAALWAWW